MYQLGSMLVATEWTDYTPLREALDAEALPVDVRLKIAKDLAKAMEWLHCGTSPPVPHLDLNSFNVLVNPSRPDCLIKVRVNQRCWVDFCGNGRGSVPVSERLNGPVNTRFSLRLKQDLMRAKAVLLPSQAGSTTAYHLRWSELEKRERVRSNQPGA